MSAIMSYLRFLRGNARFLAYGWLLTFGSSFGQTFYVSLFGAQIRADYGLSHGDYGLYYSIATVLSGLGLIWIGKRVDEVDLRPYTVAVLLGLAAACALVAAGDLVGGAGLVLLFLAFLGLRLFGQGMMTHTSVTAMARYFERDRGKAMSFASLGMTTGEAILPIVVVAVAAWIGWRETWWASTGILIVVFVPLTLWLLKGHGARDEALKARLEAQAKTGTGDAGRRQWTRAEVARDPSFYLRMPAIIASPAIMTGLFFHQVHVAGEKGWTLEWLATCFIGFAIAKVVGALGTGPLVDRFGATRLLPLLMPPQALGLAALAISDHPMAAVFYMTLSGLSVGGYIAIVGASWAELYGVRHIGAIRALISAIMMFSTAIAPVGFGALFDIGVSVNAITWASVVYCVLGMGLLHVAYQRERAQPGASAAAD